MTRLTKEALTELENLKQTALEAIQDYADRLTELRDEAEEYSDNRSEKWQESEKADIYNDWVSDLENKEDEIKNVKSELEDIELDDVINPLY